MHKEPLWELLEEKDFCELLSIKMKGISGLSWRLRLDDIKPLIHIKWCLIMLNRLQNQTLDQQQLQKTITYFEQHKQLCLLDQKN